MNQDEVQEAYLRGLHDGEVKNLADSVNRAHERIDGHDGRLTALERVMYAGLGVIMLINVLPEVSQIFDK